MRRNSASDAWYLLVFFAILIAVGAGLLCLPFAWRGNPVASVGSPVTLPPVDALFIATSAVCVTGLASVDSSHFTLFGQIVILLLIQIGGLGIISFTSLLIAIPGGRLPLRRLRTIQSFYLDSVEFDAVTILRSIILFTLIIEALGTLALWPFFRAAGVENALFIALFHSVSAFCNAGFSTFSTNLEGFSRNLPVLMIICVLIVSGGIGFIVIQDLERRLRHKRRVLSYHTKVVLGITAALILVSTLAFYIWERHRAYAGLSSLEALMNALFQSITPRTAGYDAIPQMTLTQPSKIWTTVLMFIGGAPGSIAGGIKVTTAFIVLMVMIKRPDQQGDLTVFHRRLTAKTSSDAVVYFLKALALLFLSSGALSIVEGLRGADFSMILFESVSAFGTVGLSLGLTPVLGVGGKLIIIATMFAGRVGLIALAFPASGRREEALTYREGSILLG